MLKQNIIIGKDTSAKLAELHKLQHFNTYQNVKDCGQQTLFTRWVITNKEGQTKACLVVRGFEEEFMHAGDEQLEKIMVNLRRRFVAGKVKERSFNYIGLYFIGASDGLRYFIVALPEPSINYLELSRNQMQSS